MSASDRFRISNVNTWLEHLELTRPYTIAYKTVTAVENVFIRIETADGAWGIGAGSPAAYVTGEDTDACFAALSGNAEELLLGKDVRALPKLIRDIEAKMPGTPAARTAIDIALHDLLAKQLGVPLVRMLGEAHTALPTSITIGIKSLEETLEEAEEYLGRGFKILKLKIGKSLAQDIETTRKLNEKVRGQMLIRVDANQGYSPDDLVTYARSTEGLGLDLIEQPVAKEAWEKMREVPADVRKICAGDESMQLPADALAMAAAPQPFGIYNIKLMKCGGINASMRIGNIAELAGIDLMWGCMDESIVSITGALHAALANPATRYLDLDGSLDLARDLVKGGFVLKDGYLSVSDKPGLGVEMIEE